MEQTQIGEQNSASRNRCHICGQLTLQRCKSKSVWRWGAFPDSIACSPSMTSKTQPSKRRREKGHHQNEELLLYKRPRLKKKGGGAGCRQAGREYLQTTPSRGKVSSKYKAVLKLSWEKTKTNWTIKTGQKTRIDLSQRGLLRLQKSNSMGKNCFVWQILKALEMHIKPHNRHEYYPPNWPKYVRHKIIRFYKITSNKAIFMT